MPARLKKIGTGSTRIDETKQAQLKNVSSDYCQLALQGPDALGILQKLTDLPLAEIKYYHFTEGAG